MSNSFSQRYYAEPERYAKECAIYDAIRDSFDLVYEIEPDANMPENGWILTNLYESWKYLVSDKTTTGNTISIYSLK